MKFKINALIQSLGVITIYSNDVLNVIPLSPRAKHVVTGVSITSMALAAILSHFSNPDGTSAREEYKPENSNLKKEDWQRK